MRVFYIIPNRAKPDSIKAAYKIRGILEQKGAVCYIRDESIGGLPDEESTFRYTNQKVVPKNVECVLVVGGDGTVLQAARDLIDRDIPLLGVNLGTLGYLAETDIRSIDDTIDRLLEDRFFIEERMMLQGSVVRNGHIILEDVALNDIVLVRTGRLQIVDFRIYVNDTLLCDYRADGIIVATPTGSTGYSLSAGGPIVSPEASLILLTAIAPHTINSRPVVLPDHVSVTVEICPRSASSAVFDGDTSASLETGDRICICKSEKRARFIKVHHTSFVENLRRKMN